MAFTFFRPRRPHRSPCSLLHQALYHDYVRFAAPGDGHSLTCQKIFNTHNWTGGTVRIPLASPKVIGIADYRGERA
jgi:hypothetical protein